ncbi:MAG: type II secretion system F family protein [Chloroflexi bacterium]|nr:type II secretion system F family protein [Chloroflexota bacterium]
MAYSYVAYDDRRKVVRGTIDVTTERQAMETLQRAGYSLLSLKHTTGGWSIRRQIPSLFGVRPKDVIRFSRLLATLVGKGTSTTMALQMLRDHTGNVVFRDIIDEIQEELRQGRSFSEALSKHTDAFPELYRRMVAIAERTGRLEEVLERLATTMEKEQALASSVKRALVYPTFVIVIAGGVIIMLVTFVLPSLTEMFTDFGSDIPWSTKLLVGITDFTSGNKLLLAASAFGMAIGTTIALRYKAVRRGLDALLLRMPIIGQIVQLKAMASFSRTVAAGLSSSLAMPDILDLAQRTAGNQIVSEALNEVRGEVLRGRMLSQSMARHSLFPGPLIQMTRVGEESGTLDQDLTTMAETYEREVDEKVTAFVSLLEPSLIVVMGVIVAFIVVSVILPTYSIYGNIE